MRNELRKRNNRDFRFEEPSSQIDNVEALKLQKKFKKKILNCVKN